MKENRSNQTATLLAGLGLGVASLYFLDPGRGRRRRKLVWDKAVHAGHRAAEGLETTARDLGNRTRGVAAGTRRRLEGDEADDRVIEERVRAELGRIVSHPGAIEVSSFDGRVTLNGAVLEREADTLLSRAGRVRGVAAVEDRLERHQTAGDVPALQGGSRTAPRRFELLQDNWAPAPRLLTGMGGGALALYGMRRRDGVGTAIGLAGLALLTRAATNTPLDRITGIGGGRRAVDVQKTINIDAPVDEVFHMLTQWERWPEWMTHVREVTQRGELNGRERTHWVVDGPMGVPVSWDAITTDVVPNESIAWKSDEGAAVAHAGNVRLVPTPDGRTSVQFRLSYNPPAGMLGHAVAAFFGRDPKRQMDDDLARLKTTIETGRPPHDAARRETMQESGIPTAQGTGIR